MSKLNKEPSSKKDDIKQTEEPINCENILLENLFSDVLEKTNSRTNRFHDNLDKVLKITKNEDKQFLNNLLINNTQSLSDQIFYHYHYFSSLVNDMSSHELTVLFELRKQRAVRRLMKESDNRLASEEMKMNAYRRFFNSKLSFRLLERYLKVHDNTTFFKLFNDHLFVNKLNYKYYTSYKTYDEISKHSNNS